MWTNMENLEISREINVWCLFVLRCEYFIKEIMWFEHIHILAVIKIFYISVDS